MPDQVYIHGKCLSQEVEDRREAISLLAANFSILQDRESAQQDLHKLTQDEDSSVRMWAAYALRKAFSLVTDKSQAWQDLHRLTQDKDSDVRSRAAYVLGEAFSLVPDKSQAWQDLHRLTQDEDSSVRMWAAYALRKAFSLVTDKSQAWQDLHRLTQDKDSDVRSRAAYALGEAFSLVPDKSQAWQDLHRLTQDKDSGVRMYAYHTLGRSSIFKATKSKDRKTLKRELEATVAYFERSAQESQFSPARFCHSFYRTYYAITFQEAREDEVLKYLAEAKNAVDGSVSRDDLLKVVENLAGALRESQRLKMRSFQEVTGELNAYRWYCEKAADHMAAAEGKAPEAVKLMRKCNPILEDRIQAIIAEIQKSARKIRNITHGSSTKYEVPGAEIQKAAKGLSTGDLASVQNYSTKIVWQLKKFCQMLPSEDKEQVCSLVEEIVHEADFPEKLHKILTALLCLSPVLEGEILQRIEAKVDAIHENSKFLGLYLNNIEFAILNMKVSSGNAKKDIFDIKKGIDKLQSEIETLGISDKELTIALEDKDHVIVERLTKMQEHMTRTVRDIAKLNASKRDVETILKKLDEQDGLKKMDALGIISDLSQLSQMALTIYLKGSVV